MKDGFLQTDSKLKVYQEWEISISTTYIYTCIMNFKNYLAKKISKFITLCILKREGG